MSYDPDWEGWMAYLTPETWVGVNTLVYIPYSEHGPGSAWTATHLLQVGFCAILLRHKRTHHLCDYHDIILVRAGGR